MTLHDNIRTIRKEKNITQEQMAELLEMSASGYSKLERGESQLIHDKLPRIADILGVSLKELMPDNKGMLWVNENYANASFNNYGSMHIHQSEVEKLKLIIQHKEEIIGEKQDLLKQKDKEILALNEIIELLKGE